MRSQGDVLDDAGALPQPDALAWPPLASCLVGGPSYDQVVDVGEVFHDAVAIGIPEVDVVGELHRSRTSFGGLLPCYLLSVAKIKLGKASCRCAESHQLSPSPALASQFSRSDRGLFDHGPQPPTQVE